MVSAKGLVYDSPGTAKLLMTHPDDAPLVLQLFGGEPEFIERAMHLCLERGFTHFDLNAGCPVRKVAKQRSGCAMMNDPDVVVAAAKAMVRLAGEGRVGVKMRLGWDAEHITFAELGRRLSGVGVGWLTLHPRTGRMGYSGRADWSRFAEFTAAVDTPVIASGDLFSAEAGARCLAETDVDGVMYARGALSNPRIFAEHGPALRGVPPDPPTGPRIAAVIRRHLDLIREHDPKANFRHFRNLIPRYVRHMTGAKALRQKVIECERFEELYAIVDEIAALDEHGLLGGT
jgi:tRNA-dihydrouridine synthase B